MPEFYEFFAGGGMARAGLGDGWTCRFANDFDKMKAATYEDNWGEGDLVCGDVAEVKPSQLKGTADLTWASFPCQDVSLAGDGAGVGDGGTAMTRSGTFWPFWRLTTALADENRASRLIVLENVYGLLSSSAGRDFAAIAGVLAQAKYRFGALLIDAVKFLPQSRPRLFIVAARADLDLPAELVESGPSDEWHPAALVAAADALPPSVAALWRWWRLPTPTGEVKRFADVIEDKPTGVKWNTAKETSYLLSLMSPTNRAKVEEAKKSGKRQVGGIYRRTRVENGKKVQRAEVRFDDIAGCLRTPSGGSSRQTIIVVNGKKVRSRLLSPREAARLMGLPEDYKLPKRYNDAYHLAGDGVAVPVVRHLAAHLLEPLLAVQQAVVVEREPVPVAQ